MSDFSSLLPFLLASKQGKSNLGDLSSFATFLDNPWIGVLTGTYNPLSQQSQVDIPESKVYDSIAMDPNAPLTLKRVAQGIVEEGQPVYKILNEINSMTTDGGYSKDELKSIANQLAAEKADVDKARSNASKNSMFAKGGFSEYTDQYSDNPDLAPLDVQTRGYVSNLKDLASKSRAAGESMAKSFAPASDSGLRARTLIAELGRRGALLPSDMPGRLYKSIADKANESGIIDKAEAIKLIQGMDSKSGSGKQKKVRDKLYKIVGSVEPTAYTKSSKQQFGDLSDPKNLAKYFEWQSNVQNANQLEKQANDYRDATIAKAEGAGRTPFMDELAQRMLATRLATGK